MRPFIISIVVVVIATVSLSEADELITVLDSLYTQYGKDFVRPEYSGPMGFDPHVALGIIREIKRGVDMKWWSESDIMAALSIAMFGQGDFDRLVLDALRKAFKDEGEVWSIRLVIDDAFVFLAESRSSAKESIRMEVKQNILWANRAKFRLMRLEHRR
jgi:hypothetical protein